MKTLFILVFLPLPFLCYGTNHCVNEEAAINKAEEVWKQVYKDWYPKGHIKYNSFADQVRKEVEETNKAWIACISTKETKE